MNIIENIKNEIHYHNQYKNPKGTASLTLLDKKKRNLFTYVQSRNFGKKYGEALYQHFKVMDDINDYALLIDLFGKKNLEQALSNPEATTVQIVQMICKANHISSLDEIQSENYLLSTMKNCQVFNNATDLELSEITVGIDPDGFRRRIFNNKSMLDIFQENEVTKEVLKEIYDMYGAEIVLQYTMDSELRNKSILALNQEKNEGVAIGGLQDHVTDYSEENFHEIFQKYFNQQELSKTEQCILIGLLAKESDLIGIYTVKHLREHPDYIKSEIEIGIFEEMIISGKEYTNEERRQITTLSKVWNAEKLKKYNNLELLKQRFLSFPKNQEIVDILQKIDEILKKPLQEVAHQSKEIADFMDVAFLTYEIENRNQVIENVYPPNKTEEIVIDDLSQMNSAAMLHFFNPERKMFPFESYVKDLEEKRSQELGREFKFSEDEKEAMLLQYEIKENHYITDASIDMNGIGQVGAFDARYVTNTSNQLCTMVVTPDDILKGRGTRGRIALGFSKETLEPDLIATISDKNIHSNKGIDYVESQNPFQDFSTSYDELITEGNKSGGNTEVVLFRNSAESSLKPSYVLYIGNEKLDSKKEKDNINLVKKQMKEVGLKVPLVIFDRYSIREKMKVNELSKE